MFGEKFCLENIKAHIFSALIFMGLHWETGERGGEREWEWLLDESGGLRRDHYHAQALITSILVRQ